MAKPKPYQVSDPWKGPKRPSIGNVRGPASKPKPNTAKPTAAKPSAKPTAAKPSAKPSAQPPARPGRIAGRIPMGGLKGGAIGLVGNEVASAVGYKTGQVLGTAIRKAAEPKVTGTRTGRTGRYTTSDVGGNPAKDGRYVPGSQQVKFNQAQPKPKPTPQSTPTRQDATTATRPQRSTAPSRPAASRPAATPKPKPQSAPPPPKVAETSGIGPVKEGAEYARKKGNMRVQADEIREMIRKSQERQKKK